MAGTITIPGMFLTGTHAARPAANAVGKGSLYACSDHKLIYQSDGSSWTTWLDASGSGGTPVFVGARVYNSANQSLNNGSYTVLTFDTERFDTDAFHSTVSNTSRLTVPSGKAGKYLIGGSVNFGSNATGHRFIEIYLNGTTTIGTLSAAPVNGTSTNFHVNTVYQLAVADYVELRVFTNQASMNSVASPNWAPEFWCALLGT